MARVGVRRGEHEPRGNRGSDSSLAVRSPRQLHRRVLASAMALVVVAGSMVGLASASAVPPTTPKSSVSKPQSRVYGGKIASPNATRGFIALDLGVARGPKAQPEWICGGSAISKRWILTAAHCVREVRKVISFNASMATSKPGTAQKKQYKLDRVVIYPGSTYLHDIALVRTTTDMDVVPLKYDGNKKYLKKGRKLSVYGMGIYRGQRIAKNVRVGNVIDRSGDSKYCGRYGRDYDRRTMLCAGSMNGKIDSCQGDSGGPLVTRGSKRVLVGLVSFGYECGSKQYPGVYVRVSKYAKWIHRHTKVKPAKLRK